MSLNEQQEANRQKEIRRITNAVNNSTKVSIVTYYLSDYGEKLLHDTARIILEKYNRSDLLDVVYSAAKELVINATKANLKRVLFAERGIDPLKTEDYEKGMGIFKEELVEERIKQYRTRFKESKLSVTATFYYSENVLNVKVKNNFPLYPIEEERIRDRFKKAVSFSSLLDFYMEYGDDTEGAGLGLTVVGILLDGSGIDKHAFTLFSNRFNETAARLEIPLNENYTPRRKQFEEELESTGMDVLELRKVFKPKL